MGGSAMPGMGCHREPGDATSSSAGPTDSPPGGLWADQHRVEQPAATQTPRLLSPRLLLLWTAAWEMDL